MNEEQYQAMLRLLYPNYRPEAKMSRMTMPSERTRAYVYRVLLAAIPLLVGFGLVQESDVSVWIGLVGAVLSTGLATANTSR